MTVSDELFSILFNDCVKLRDVIAEQDTELLALREQTRWIPISEPPPLNIRVLGTHNFEYYFACIRGNDGTYYLQHFGTDCEEPTHYQLISWDLPSAPDGDDKRKGGE
jgi:hypothetical protein